MYNSEEPPHKKSKGDALLSPESCLTHDLLISFMARLSRLEYAALSLTSKTYRSLVASPYLYKTRSLMGRTETYLYVCLRTPLDTTPRWYILRRRKTLDASDLIPIPWLPSQPEEASSVVVLDWGIYVIGGTISGERTSDVWLLDCRTHTWGRVPSMRLPRAYGAAGVVDGKIYVIGGCKIDAHYSFHWGEVFDPKTQTWDFLNPLLGQKNHDRYILASLVSDHKVYAVDGTNRTLYYSPRQGIWGRGNRGQLIGNRRDWCMIDNLVYCIGRNGTIFWCESDELGLCESERMMNTKEVKGLGLPLQRNLFRSRVAHYGEQIVNRWERQRISFGIPLTSDDGVSHELKDLLPGARLSNSGGNIVLFWDVINGNHLEIWCAEISLERRQGGDIWGNIERSNVVMNVDPFVDRYKILYSASVTL